MYGLLNQNDNGKVSDVNPTGRVHFVKINKAFLGEEDVNVMAQVRDSSEYGADEITVVIEATLNGSYKDSYTLSRVTKSTKEDGTFYSPEHVMYQFTDSLPEEYDYKLVITKTATGEQVFAETKLVRKNKGQTNEFRFIPKSYWNKADPKVNFYANGNYFPFTKAYWQTAENGRRYQLTIRFHYTELNLTTGATTEKSIDWVFAKEKAPDLEGGDEIGSDIPGEDFYKFIETKLDPPPANIKRCIGRAQGAKHMKGQLDFIVDGAGEDFNTYMEVNEPATGIVQERPEYTNVFDQNGNEQAGFFSSRFTIIKEGAVLDPDAIGGNSITELKTGQYTGDLGFIVNTDNSNCPIF